MMDGSIIGVLYLEDGRREEVSADAATEGLHRYAGLEPLGVGVGVGDMLALFLLNFSIPLAGAAIVALLHLHAAGILSVMLGI